MAKDARARFSRRLLVGTVVVGVLILCNLGLFGMLLFRSLSEQELRRVLGETRTEAEELASQLAGEVEREGADLFTAIVQEQETQTYIDRVLTQREIVETVRIFDSAGTLVFEKREESSESADESADLGLDEPSSVQTKVLRTETPYEVLEVPVGKVGSFVIGLSKTELDRRVQVLRGELIRTAAPIAVLTVVLLVGAYILILWLVRRGRKLEGRAREAEQLAYVGTLASGLAHEIRSPLNSLNLNMQMLEEEAGEREGSSRQRILSIARSEITRLENLVTDFLSYARPRPLEICRVRAVDLLHRVKSVLSGELRAGSVELEVVDSTGGAEVEVDVDQLSQLLLNLVQNGIFAAEKSGRLPHIRLLAERLGGRLRLSVEDNGGGIPEAERDRIFDLFYSTRKGGTGLGLAIARRIAHEHGGELSVDSPSSGGTRVGVALAAAGKSRLHDVAEMEGRPSISAIS